MSNYERIEKGHLTYSSGSSWAKSPWMRQHLSSWLLVLALIFALLDKQNVVKKIVCGKWREERKDIPGRENQLSSWRKLNDIL